MRETDKVYCDLESLLDLRQGVLRSLMDGEALADYMTGDVYNLREKDEFPVDMMEYKRLLASGDFELIKQSTINFNIGTIGARMMDLSKKNTGVQGGKDQELVINTYPFQLSDEILEQFREGVFHYLKGKGFISFIHEPLSNITPLYLQANHVSYAFIYRFNEWLDAVGDGFVKNPTPDILVYAPALIFQTPNMAKQYEYHRKGFDDAHSMLTLLMSQHIRFTFVPVFYYSNHMVASRYDQRYIKRGKKEHGK